MGDAGRVDLYTRLRWVGVALFCVAAPVFAAAVTGWVLGQTPGGLIPWAMFAMGLSLGSFGSNDDSAVYQLRELARAGAVPERHRAEWDAERRARPGRIVAVHAHPKGALILPVAAIVMVAIATWRVAGAWLS
jgi:hypothetical protein